ncbi:hypothetical protein D6C84_09287 [Aureobasidium pullulans]|uniref:C2H2-type domain-containing protein n=1 Tax=Aureobasidium pullulans TaxID=5580 RepID=A0A4S9X768_AURPU|nr:hypothetical protein D6C84_09287 [Aureobasidium pullulans]
MFENNELTKEELLEAPEESSASVSNRKRRRRDDTNFECQVCHRIFGRIEHLRRHANSHGEARSFKCVACGKGFNRLYVISENDLFALTKPSEPLTRLLNRDTLQRHELIHQKDPGVSKLKGARACKECAGSKVRCNGTMPCERCTVKQTDCVYPSAASPAQAQDSPSSAISDFPSTPGTSENASSSMLESASFPRQLEQSLPNVGHAVPFPEHHALNVSDTWNYNPHPETASQSNHLPPGSLPTYIHGLSLQDSNGQQTALSPFAGSYSGTEASFEITYTSSLSRDRHASLDQLSRRPRLVPNLRSRTAVMDSNSPTSQLMLASHQGESAHDQSDLRGTFHRSFNPSTSYLSRRRRFNFPLSGDVLPAFQSDDYTSFDMLSEQTYSAIHGSFIAVCTGLTAHQPVYGSSCFPSRKTLNALVKLYFERFHPVMPILHHPTLNLNTSHWILSLVIVTIGSHMSDFEQAEEYSLCLDEFLRRAISALDPHETIDRITLCQTKLLACINQIYSGEESWQESAYNEFLTDLVAFCQLEWKMSEAGFTTFAPEGHEAEFWERWVQLESCRRTGYAIWMLDTMWAYHFQVQPRLTLEDGRIPLPCQEVLWETKSALQWHHIFQFSPPNLTLLSALQTLQDHKDLQSTMGEFSRIILLHGFYHQSWEMERAEIRSQPRPHQMSTFALWRDSVCDSLEVLQWSANNVVNAASGMEHPTILHLHLARIVLFAPFQNICDLAYGMTKEDTSIGTAQMANLRTSIRKWVIEDESKARLAALHAGILLKHIRSFHTNSFYEPSAVLLATLTLWAYGAFTTTAIANRPPLQRRFSDTQGHPISIALDQPLEPDLVRSFIRDGRDMAPTLRGVGSIRGAGGPQRVLLEGSKLVSEIGRFGVGRKVIRVLNNLSLCRSI